MTPPARESGPIIVSVEERERAMLAPYAMFSSHSRGRRHAEPLHSYRGPFQRDRDRILHCSAFRRLSGKMQVFTGDMGDYHRTRLTHTQEVASIARTIARALRLNEDLVEALTLLHDIGHPPFGHAGEDALHACLAGEGGFSHNAFALALVEQIERRYPAFPGLNLTEEVLQSQAARIGEGASALPPLLEAQVVEASDSIAYDAHDCDDAVKLGLITIDALREAALFRRAVEAVHGRFGKLDGAILRKAVVHELIDVQVGDVVRHSSQRLRERCFADAEQARSISGTIGPGGELAEQQRELERLLYDGVYRHPRLVEVRESAQQRLRRLFDRLLDDPSGLPRRFSERAGRVGLPRAVGDYLAGMTDRYCNEQYLRLVEGAG